jgi:transcriptional regulator with XRE-family HTH domain
MKDRILKFLSSENKTSSQFAEEIGVQPSGVSHILSGRNNPSLDFVTKMLHRYPNLSTEWLLFGKEPMYKRFQEPTLFDQLPFENISTPDSHKLLIAGSEGTKVITSTAPESESENFFEEEPQKAALHPVPGHRSIERIVFFYKDRSFREFNPEG